MKFINKVSIMFLSATLCACVIQNRKIENEIIYQLKGGKLVDVYNLDQRWVSTEDVSYLSARNKKYGEFGGQLSICSDDNYHCVNSGIDMVIPKNFSGQKEWEYSGRVCNSNAALDGNHEFIIVCVHNKNTDKVLFSYSRGIISYTRSPNWDDLYELVNDKGLFANSK